MTASHGPLSRRSLLATGTAAGLALCGEATAAITHQGRGEATVLTISGLGVHPNRGPMNPARDLLLNNHGLGFEAARTFSAAALARLEQVQITTGIEYDDQPHRLRGPLLATVLQAAGVDAAAAARQDRWLSLQAIDGYRAQMPLAQALGWRMLVVTRMDDHPLSLGDLGPQWAMYDAAGIAELAARPVKERFAKAPWGLYHLGLQARENTG